MSYPYWNRFIDTWRNLPPNEYSNPQPTTLNINGWTNPNLIPLFGTSAMNDLSLQYLPEPWWGNNGNYPLESVVVNYNPAGLNNNYFGVNAQQHITNSRNLFGHRTYADFIDNEVLTQSTRFPGKYTFHFSKRAKRIFESLIRNGVVLAGSNLENHLSIELAPWYTPNSNLILSYIRNNINNVYSNCLVFAANESRRIVNHVLKKK